MQAKDKGLTGSMYCDILITKIEQEGLAIRYNQTTCLVFCQLAQKPFIRRMVMFKRELRYNFKSFVIWLIISILLFGVVFAVYPSIITGENAKMIDEMMKVFPQEILKAFNMDIASLDSAYGWLKSEGLVFIMLIAGCYAGILGSNILLKEENDKTIEYLNSLPVRRNNIVISKVLASLIYIVSFVLILGVFNLVCLLVSGDFDVKQYLLLSITPLFPSLVLFFVCLYVSTFTHKTKKMLGVGLGIVLVSYLLQTLSVASQSVEFLQYFSVFTLADTRNIK